MITGNVSSIKPIDIERTAFLCGIFELITPSDVCLIQAARKLADTVIVGVYNDYWAERILNRHPILTDAMRYFMVDNIRNVDYVLAMNSTPPLGVLNTLKPTWFILSEKAVADKKPEYDGVEIVYVQRKWKVGAQDVIAEVLKTQKRASGGPQDGKTTDQMANGTSKGFTGPI